MSLFGTRKETLIAAARTSTRWANESRAQRDDNRTFASVGEVCSERGQAARQCAARRCAWAQPTAPPRAVVTRMIYSIEEPPRAVGHPWRVAPRHDAGGIRWHGGQLN
jgi:hypothetical protein